MTSKPGSGVGHTCSAQCAAVRPCAAALDGQLVNAGPFVLQEALFKNDLDLTFGDSQLRTAAACFYNATIF